MSEIKSRDDVFPKGTTKTYGLMGLMRGESPLTEKGPDDRLFAFPIVLLVELVLGLGTTLIVLLVSLLRDAPLEEIANPLVTTNPAKAPWYFVGLQEMLEHMHPTMAGILIPTVLLGFLIILPYIDNSRKGAGRWFTSPRGKRITILSALYALMVMPAYILVDNAVNLQELLRDAFPPSLGFVGQGVIPGLLLTFLAFVPALSLYVLRLKPSAREVVLAIFTVLFFSAIVFTISGFLFRGPSFQLYWPGNFPNGYNPLNTF